MVCETSVSQLNGQGWLCCHEGSQGQAQKPQPLPPWITQPLCHHGSSTTPVPSCCPCLGRTGQISVLWKVICHHHHPLTHHSSSHHGGDGPLLSPRQGLCYAPHQDGQGCKVRILPPDEQLWPWLCAQEPGQQLPTMPRWDR